MSPIESDRPFTLGDAGTRPGHPPASAHHAAPDHPFEGSDAGAAEAAFRAARAGRPTPEPRTPRRPGDDAGDPGGPSCTARRDAGDVHGPAAGGDGDEPDTSAPLSQAEKAERARGLALDTGGRMPDACWAMIYDFETAPWTTDAHRLEEAGFTVVPSDEVDDADLPERLDALGRALAAIDVFVRGHERYDDRELYRVLVQAMVHEPRKDVRSFPHGGGWVIALDDFADGPPPVDLAGASRNDRRTRCRRRHAFPPVRLPDDLPISVSGPRGPGFHHCMRPVPRA